MRRLFPYLGIVLATIVIIMAEVLFGNAIGLQRNIYVGTSSASTTQFSVVIPKPQQVLTKDIASSSTKISIHKVKPKPDVKHRAPTAKNTGIKKYNKTILSISKPKPVKTITTENKVIDATANTLRNALVNILCYAPAGSEIHSISGSGIIVSQKGIILTNAHIAQYFLLFNKNISCVIRTGSPAINAYKASLIYISPLWIKTNSSVLLSRTTTSGTGEYDFAFLAITKSATNKTLPDIFPYISLSTIKSSSDAPVVIASYGAQFLAPNQVLSDLFPTVVFGSIKKIFTFATSSIDILALGGSAAAQEGSSGGGVASASGFLVGTITTSTVIGPTKKRSLNAISSTYISREYTRETGDDLYSLFNKPPKTSIANFASRIPSLESIITTPK